MMKKYLNFLVFIFLSLSLSAQQNILSGEYFWDADPGEGNGTSLLVLDGNFDQAIEDLFSSGISVNGLSPGAHSFKVRVKGFDGQWSSTFSQTIFLDGALTTISRDAKVTMGEYFWDADPGEGNGTSLLALDGNFDQAIEDLFSSGVSVNGLSPGAHSFKVRVKGFDGQWSSTFSQTIFLDGALTTISRDAKVTMGEYFWDTDPGEGNGTSLLALDGNFDQAIEELFSSGISVNGLSPGAHSFKVRVRGFDGQWSSNYSQTIVKIDTTCSQVPVQSSVTICNGSNYVFGTQTLVNSGVYSETFTTSSGCDSIVNLTLTVSPAIQNNITASICSGESYVFGAQTLVNSGTYSETFTALSGCDSTVNLTLSVLPVFSSSFSESVCFGDSYVFGSQTLTQTGTYTEVFTSVLGCDSTVVLSLTILDDLSSSITDTICSGSNYVLGTQTLSQTGTYTEIFSGSSGCDSIVTLNLTVYALPIASITFSGGILNANLNTVHQYQWLLDGNEILGANNASFSPTEDGCYAIVITGSNCTNTSDCYMVNTLGMFNIKNQMNIVTYPNPTTNIMTVESSELVQIRIFNLSGGLLYNDLNFTNNREVNLNFYEAGVYVLEVKNKSGDIQHKRLIKQ
jgi:hypothetical protein